MCSTPCPPGSSARLKLHITDSRIVGYLGTTPVLDIARSWRRNGDKAVRRVDYRHLIGSLVKKPGAFRHSVFREDLFPRTVFRRAWAVLDHKLDPRKACRVYVGLLHLAAMHAAQSERLSLTINVRFLDALSHHLEQILDSGQVPDLEIARAAVAPVPNAAPALNVSPPDLKAYDSLLANPPHAASTWEIN